MQNQIACQPGPQLQAAKSPATVVVYGGAAGGGKSFFQAWRAAKFHNVKGYSAALFRRTFTMLQGSGSLWDECMGFYPSLGAEHTTRPLEFTWPHPSRVEFRHLQHEGDELDHKSKQYAFLGFDEASDFTNGQFVFMLSRLRTTCGVKTQMLLTTNPDPDCYLRTWIDWWIDPADGFPIPERCGKIRYFVRIKDKVIWGNSRAELEKYVDNPEHDIMSMTFIPARVTDNKVLLEKDPSYLAKLKSLPEVEQLRFLMGNWNAREASGDFFQMHWFKLWGATPLERALMQQDDFEHKVVASVRWWDLAATAVEGNLVPGIERPADFKCRPAGDTKPDWTFGVRLDRLRNGKVIVADSVAFQDSPGAVEAAIIRYAQEDGPGTVVGLWQDPGQAAIGQMERLKARLEAAGITVAIEIANKNKELYAREPSRACYRGEVFYKKGKWNDRFFNQLQTFPPPTKDDHDDAVDAFSGGWHYLAQSGPIVPGYKSANRPGALILPGDADFMLPPNRERERLQVRGRGATNRFGHRVL